MANVREFGARGDGKSDDTAALSHAIQKGDGELVFPRGDYRISRTLYIALQTHGRLCIRGEGGARILMSAAGPALHLVGTHGGTADPDSVQDNVWAKERQPILSALEIVGAHDRADGIRLEGVMQPTLHALLIRQCRHGIHLVKRNRNVDISSCHIYEHRGVGVYLDHVNLHQINIHGNHISYCKQGGIKIVGSEIRNLQICSNDIEYNYDLKAKTSADVLFDCREGTVREGTITGCTIQAKQSPGGANVRFLGQGEKTPNAVGLFTISGNLIGSQETAVDLQSCRGVVVGNNCIYSGYHRAIHAANSEHLVIASNSIDHNPQYRGKSTDQIVLERCRNVNVQGLILQHTLEAEKEVEASIELSECENVNRTGCQIIDPRSRGIRARNCKVVRIADCTIRGEKFKLAVEVDGKCRNVLVSNGMFNRGTRGAVYLPKGSGQEQGGLTL